MPHFVVIVSSNFVKFIVTFYNGNIVLNDFQPYPDRDNFGKRTYKLLKLYTTVSSGVCNCVQV